MRPVKFLPAALLMATLGASGMAYAQDAGDAQSKEHDKKGWEHSHEGGPWSALPEEKRKLLHNTMEKVHKENAALHEQAHKLHGELNVLMVAPQFDQAAYQKKSAELDDMHHKMKENMKQEFTSILGKFTQEERIELLMMQHMMKFKMHHQHFHDNKEEHTEKMAVHHNQG